MTEELNVKITAEASQMKKACKDAENSIKGVESQSKTSTSAIGDVFGKIGKVIAGAFTVKAITDFTKGCIEAASEIAEVGATFEFVVGEQVGLANSKLDEFSNKTGIMSGRVKESYSQIIATYQGLQVSQEQAIISGEKLLENSADMAAMWNTTAEEVLPTLQSAITGNYIGLKKYGIVLSEDKVAQEAVNLGLIESAKDYSALDDSQKALIRTDVVSYMLELQGVMGRAQAESNGLENTTANLKQAWDEFKASVGEPILDNIVIPAIQTLTTIITSAKDKVDEWAQKFDEIKTKLSDADTWGTNINTLTSDFDDTSKAASNSASAIKKNKEAFELAAIGVGTLTAAILAYNAAAIASSVASAAETVALVAMITWDYVVAAAKAVATAATTAFGVAVQFATSPITLIIVAIGALIAIIVLCVNHWDEIKQAVSKAVAAIKGFVSDMVGKVKEKFNEMKENISNKIEDIKSNITEKWTNIKEKVSDTVSNIKDKVKDGFDNMKENIKSKLETAKSNAQSAWDNIKTTTTTAVENAKSVVSDKFSNIKSSISDAMATAKSNVSTAFSNIASSISSGLQTALSNTQAKLQSIKEKFTSIFDSCKETVSNAIDKIKSAFNFSWSLPKLSLPHISISGKFSLNPPSVPKFGISWYAKGGVFDMPTLFGYGNHIGGLGENGAEAIVPLEKNTEWLDKIAERLNSNATNTPIVLQVDGKTFAQTSINTINQMTRQTGRLALNVM